MTNEDYQPDCCTALYDAIGASFVKISELIEPGDQVFFAIFTDGLENASKHYRAEDIQFKLDEADKKGWAVKFFCRYEDRRFHESKLMFKKGSVVGLSLDAAGFKVMENNIRYSLNDMFQKQKKQKS